MFSTGNKHLEEEKSRESHALTATWANTNGIAELNTYSANGHDPLAS